MVFIDGENLCIRCQNMLKKSGYSPTPGRYYVQDSFIWFQNKDIYTPHDPLLAAAIPNRVGGYDPTRVIRAFYYTSVFGEDQRLRELEQTIWTLKMQPVVFKKVRKSEKAKGVDIALTKDMLVHAFQNNYDIAVLVAGDGDYVPVIEEVKRQGKRVILQFLNPNEGQNPRLKLTCDEYSYDPKPGGNSQAP